MNKSKRGYVKMNKSKRGYVKMNKKRNKPKRHIDWENVGLVVITFMSIALFLSKWWLIPLVDKFLLGL